MRNINLLFDGNIDDVDIICVPCEIADNIVHIANLYFSWMHNNINEHSYWVLGKNGTKILCYETESFIWWINNQYNQPNCNKQAFVVLQHTHLNSEYSIVNF